MSKDKLPFKTYRARRRPWDRFRRSQFDRLEAEEGVGGAGAFPPPGPPSSGAEPPRRPTSPASEPSRRPVPPAAGPPPRRPSPPPSGQARRSARPHVPRRPLRRFVKYFAIWVAGWLLISAVLFALSATIESGRISDATNAELGGGGNFVTSPGTVLVLGLDRRPKGSKEPGADTVTARSDSIMLLRTGAGKSNRVSILRDSYAQIPGYQAQKINAAYAIGGAALTIRTVEQFLGNGVDINHIVIVDFERFPDLIDALGGVTVKVRTRCVRSTFGGKTFKLRRGEHHLNGDRALRYARVRKNECDPSEDDRDRARRQQEVMSAMKSKAFSPLTFVRLPWVSWAAPKAIVTDMSPVTLMGFLSSVTLGPDPKTFVLQPSAPGPAGSLIVSEAERARAARRLLR